MTPSIDLRISTIVRAMEDVVAPAIDQDNSLAREQAALIIGHLHLLAAQWSRAESYAQVCLGELSQTLRPLIPVGGPLTQNAATALNEALQTKGRAEVQYKQVMAAAEALVRASDEDGDAAFRAKLRAGLLDFSAAQSLRDRSWFSGSGFDLHPDQLIPMDDLTGMAAE